MKLDKRIEDAILTTLVVENKMSLPRAIEKIQALIEDVDIKPFFRRKSESIVIEDAQWTFIDPSSAGISEHYIFLVKEDAYGDIEGRLMKRSVAESLKKDLIERYKIAHP